MGARTGGGASGGKGGGGGGVNYGKVERFLQGNGWTTETNSIFQNKYNENNDNVARAGWIETGTVFAPKGTVQTVKMKDIVPGQKVVGTSNLKSVAKSMATEGQKETPFGVRVGKNGKVILLDGHHRVGAQIISGKKSTPIRIVTVSKEAWKAHGGTKL